MTVPRRSKPTTTLVWGAALVFAWQAAVLPSYAAGRNFFDLCSTALPLVDEFAKECVANARPMHRTFEVGGRPIPELHYFYISPSVAAGHFALGCRLDREKRITFLGLYYAVKGETFASANRDRLLFVDFDGNAGTLIDGKMRVMLAIWPLLASVNSPLQTPLGCGAPNNPLAHLQVGSTHTRYKVTLNGSRADIEACLLATAPSFPEKCHRRDYRALGPQSTPRIIHDSQTIVLNELGGAYISDQSFERVCINNGRPGTERTNIIKEICADLEPK